MQQQLKWFRATQVPVKSLKGEQWAILKVNTRCVYKISTMGRIYSYATDKILKGKMCDGTLAFEYTPANKKDLGNYQRTGKKRKMPVNKKITSTVHNLVAETFLKKPKGLCIAIHKNYDRMDNSVKNIMWMPVEKQIHHSRNSPNYKYGSGSKKLTEAEVISMRRMVELKRKGELKQSMAKIASIFKITDVHLMRVCRGECFPNVKGPISEKKEQKKLSANEVAIIRGSVNNNVTGKALADRYNVTPTTISRIKHGKSYASI